MQHKFCFIFHFVPDFFILLIMKITSIDFHNPKEFKRRLLRLFHGKKGKGHLHACLKGNLQKKPKKLDIFQL